MVAGQWRAWEGLGEQGLEVDGSQTLVLELQDNKHIDAKLTS